MDTFVIRLWSPADLAMGAGDTPRGVVRHVGTGRAAAFRDGPELLALLRELRQLAKDGSITVGDASRVEPA